MVERWLDGYDGLKEVERVAGEFVEGTREKELSELERLLVGEERQRVVVVQGPFGIGKSCLLAQLCAKGGLLKEHRASGWLRNSLLRPLSERKKGGLVVGAAHFFLFSDDDAEKSKSLSVCLYSIAHQLCSIVSGLREELEKIQDELETVDDLKTLFGKVLVTPLQRMNKMDGVVVVLDGVEALPTVERQVLLEVICEHWEREMPSWISVVVSSRPARKALEAFKTIKMEYESEENKKDLEVYLKKRLEPVVVEREVDLSESVKYVIRRAKGMFLYAREVTQVVLEKEPHSLKVLDVCEIVEQAEQGGCGLDEVYRRVFQWLLEDSLCGDLNSYQVVASALAVARFPIPQDLVNDLTNTQVWEAFGELFQFENCIQIPHKTFAEFLLSKRRAKTTLHVVSKLGHETLVEALAADAMSPLAIRHLIFHLCQLKDWDKVREYVMDFDWLVAVVSTSGAAQQVIDDLDAWYINNEFAETNVASVARVVDCHLEQFEIDPERVDENLRCALSDRSFSLHSSQSGDIWLCESTLDGSSQTLTFPLRKVLREKRFTAIAVRDNILMYSVSPDHHVRICEVCCSFRYLDKVLLGHSGLITSIAIMNTEKAVTGSRDNTVRLWSWKHGVCLTVVSTRSIPSRHFPLVAACNGVATFFPFWAPTAIGVENGELNSILAHCDVPTCIDTDEHIMAVGCEDGTVHFCELQNDIRDWMSLLCRQRAPIYLIKVVQSKVVFTVWGDNTVQVWDVKTGICLHILQMESVFSLTSFGGWIVTTCGIWDVRNGQRLWNFKAISEMLVGRQIFFNGNLLFDGPTHDIGVEDDEVEDIQWLRLWDFIGIPKE